MIPYMDRLTDALDDWRDETSHPSVVRMAAKRGRIVLDKYYGKSDDSIIFRIAMSES